MSAYLTAGEITARIARRHQPFPALPPYEVPRADADLFDCGINYGALAPEVGTCKRCGLAFLPIHNWSERLGKFTDQRRTACHVCIGREDR